MARALGRFGPRLLQRVLTATEQTQRHWDGAALAKRWAQKEAVAKALGTGIGARLSFQDITITHDAHGAPLCAVRSRPGKVLVSVTDEAGVATAVAVWEHA